MREGPDYRRWFLCLFAIGAVVLISVIAIVTRPRQISPQAKQLVGLWRASLGPGHRIVLRMMPDGNCEQAAFSSDFAQEGERSRFAWELDGDTLLANRVGQRASLLDEWMADLYSLIDSGQAIKILSVTDSQFTIQGRAGPIVYERIQSDPAFPKISD